MSIMNKKASYFTVGESLVFGMIVGALGFVAMLVIWIKEEFF